MKKCPLIGSLFSLILIGCSANTMYFHGQGGYGRGEYTANIFEKSTREEGSYIFNDKTASKDTAFKAIEIDINHGETRRRKRI